MEGQIAEVPETWSLDYLSVSSGNQTVPTATVRLKHSAKKDGEVHQDASIGDGPVDAAFNAVNALFAHHATLQLYQVHAVTEGTDAQATVSVRVEEDGRIATGQSADTDTVVASVRAYIGALNRLRVRREKTAPDADVKGVSYKSH